MFVALFFSPVTAHPSQVTLVIRFPARAANAQFAQFFLQTLAMEADGCGGTGNVPAVRSQFFGDPSNFKFAFGFPKIAVAHSSIFANGVLFGRERLSACDFT